MTAAQAPAAARSRKWELSDGIAELETLAQERARQVPTLVARGALTEAEATARAAALAGTLTFLRFCKEHEAALRAFMAGVAKRGKACA